MHCDILDQYVYRPCASLTQRLLTSFYKANPYNFIIISGDNKSSVSRSWINALFLHFIGWFPRITPNLFYFLSDDFLIFY